MSWLKMGRWVLVGVVALNGAAACGGRANLPAGADTGDEFGGAFAMGGASAFAGNVSMAGAVAAGGSALAGAASFGGAVSFGGVTSFGGSIGTSGVGGAPVCVPGLGMCMGNSIAVCNGSGTGYSIKNCGMGLICVQNGDVANCQKQICMPGQVQCDPTGRIVQVCSGDGGVLINKLDCSAQGQRCTGGACQSLVCQPNQLFCDRAGVRLCNVDGSGSNPWQNCGPNQFCDPLSLSCRQGICAPNQPACNGSVATRCNANGSGYVGPGFDCAAELDRQCVLGACLCAPNLADCDGFAVNGCETNVATDPNNCSGCGIFCSTNHVSNRKCDGSCVGTCQAGFEDCNADMLDDGCETGISSDISNCGGCGLACSNNHVVASCAGGACNGACRGRFLDCNGSKQIDGCETDPLTDAENCGGCGVVCSANHIKQVCSAGSCAGDCASGFADCNGNKQADGCEIDLQNDKLNCGMCGNICPGNQSCSGGKCGASLFTFSGIKQNLPIASLTGWSQCYAETYGQAVTKVAAVQQVCSGSLLMMACRPKGSGTLQLAAYGPRADVMFAGVGDIPHNANGVGWYFASDQSWGFAPQGDPISRNSCDTQDSVLSAGVDGALRLCWHTTGNIIQGGWRCGKNDSLNESVDYERLLFTAP